MLLKLLKYDIKSIWKLALTLSVLSVGVSFGGGMCFRGFYDMMESGSPSPFSILLIFGFMLSIFAVCAACAALSIVVYLRFYKNLFTDEGYLTFTLPVSRRMILLSKTINMLIWSTVSAVVGIICYCIYFSFMPESMTDGVTDTSNIIFGTAPESINIWQVWSIISIITIILIYSVFALCLVHLCIALGAMLVKRGKLILGIGFYVGISGAVETVVQVLIIIGTLIYESFFGLGKPMYDTVVADVATAVMLFICSAISAVMLFLTYFFTQKIIDRRLNLA